MKMYENVWKCMKMYENVWKCMKMYATYIPEQAMANQGWRKNSVTKRSSLGQAWPVRGTDFFQEPASGG
jgi:hypothetical protein